MLAPRSLACPARDGDARQRPEQGRARRCWVQVLDEGPGRQEGGEGQAWEEQACDLHSESPLPMT